MVIPPFSILHMIKGRLFHFHGLPASRRAFTLHAAARRSPLRRLQGSTARVNGESVERPCFPRWPWCQQAPGLLV